MELVFVKFKGRKKEEGYYLKTKKGYRKIMILMQDTIIESFSPTAEFFDVEETNKGELKIRFHDEKSD